MWLVYPHVSFSLIIFTHPRVPWYIINFFLGWRRKRALYKLYVLCGLYQLVLKYILFWISRIHLAINLHKACTELIALMQIFCILWGVFMHFIKGRRNFATWKQESLWLCERFLQSTRTHAVYDFNFKQ